MNSIVTCVLFVLTQLSVFGSSVVLPQKCYVQDSPGLKAKAQSLVRTLAKGIPELWTEQLDPMHIDGYHIDLDGFTIDWRDVTVTGLSDAIVDDISIDMNSKLMRIVFHNDLSSEGNYIGNSYLLCMPFIGAGHGRINFYNIQTEFIIPFEIVRDNFGRDVIDLRGYKYEYNIRDYTTFHFGNMYNGCAELTQKMHGLLHQNWKYLTTKYARYLFDMSNDKIFIALRTLLHYMPLESVSIQQIAYVL